MTAEEIKARLTELSAEWNRLRYAEHELTKQRAVIEAEQFRLNRQLRAAREAEATAALARGPAVVVAIEEREDG